MVVVLYLLVRNDLTIGGGWRIEYHRVPEGLFPSRNFNWIANHTLVYVYRIHGKLKQFARVDGTARGKVRSSRLIVVRQRKIYSTYFHNFFLSVQLKYLIPLRIFMHLCAR